MTPAVAAPVNPIRICSRVGCAHSDAAGSVKETTLQKRSPFVRYLSTNWVLHYQKFTSFTPPWNVVFSLSYFWAQMAIQISSLEEERFQRNTFGLGLRLEIFN